MATLKKPKPQISREQIIDEALALLKETNLSGVTMRTLADRLGIKAASLYWHFPNKAALEAAMTQRLFIRNAVTAPQAGSFAEWMRSAGRHSFRSLMEYSDSGLLIRKAEVSEEMFAETMDVVKNRMANFDVDRERAMGLHAGVEALISGWVAFAQSPYAAGIEAAFNTEKTAFETLDALVAGWDMQPRR